MQSGAANMGEDGNYFSDFHRKLAEINFNWGISSMHKYRGNLHTSPDLTSSSSDDGSEADIRAQCVNVILPAPGRSWAQQHQYSWHIGNNSYLFWSIET